MTIYIPLIYFENDDQEISDFVFYGFKDRTEAEMMYPNAEIMQIDAGGVDPSLN